MFILSNNGTILIFNGHKQEYLFFARSRHNKY